jgi:predicted O-methyltransferase YrrM
MFQRSESDVHRHHPDEQAHLFTSGDGCDAEAEYVDLLYSLVRVLKPKLILETGTYTAVGTHVMINALIANDQPAMIHTVDIDDFPAARPVIERSPKHVTRHLCSSLDFIHNNRYDYDFVFLDSDLKIRAR